jgi:hypothetical protein
MEIPMLDEAEYAIAADHYNAGFTRVGTIAQRMQPLLDYYEQVTGMKETIPDAVMHHRISLYGSSCEVCGKPYRTPLASFCAACGHRREKSEE